MMIDMHAAFVSSSTAGDALQEADAVAVARLANRDAGAFGTLMTRYSHLAAGVANRIVRNTSIAEEVVQDAFLALWQNPSRYAAERASFRSWFLAAVHHKAVDRVRREESQRSRAVRASEPQTAAPDPAEAVVEDALVEAERHRVRLALDALPVEQRQVVELMYFGGKTQSSIACELGIPLGTVKSRTLLAMRKLRSILLARATAD